MGKQGRAFQAKRTATACVIACIEESVADQGQLPLPYSLARARLRGDKELRLGASRPSKTYYGV